MATKTEWRDRASGFFALSSMKLRNVTQTAGIFMGDVAKDAGTGIGEVAEIAADVAERAGLAMRSHWSLLQQTRQKGSQKSYPSDDTVQERLKSAAASTTVLLKRSLLETKDKVAIGRTRVEQVAKLAAQRSRTILERLQKGNADIRVFGSPLEAVVQRQKSARPIPQIVIICVDYITTSGLNAQNIFKTSGNQQVVQNLRYHFEQDWNMSIPEGTDPVDVAVLLKHYLQMLPEPLLTFSLYPGLKEARGNVQELADLVRTLPYAHYSTLECLMSLLQRISQRSALNKMDAHGLAFDLTPYLIWKQSGPHELPSNPYNRLPTGANFQPHSEFRDVDIVIPLDDDEPMMADFAIVEAVQCLIEQQKVIFADPMEAFWQEFGD